MNIIKQLFCKHNYEFVRNIYGDEIRYLGWKRSENLEMDDNCYGCGYYANGDIKGCKLTIVFHKNHPTHINKEYEQYMFANDRRK